MSNGLEFISDPRNKPGIKPADPPGRKVFISDGMGDQATIKRKFLPPPAPVLNGYPHRKGT